MKTISLSENLMEMSRELKTFADAPMMVALAHELEVMSFEARQLEGR